MLRAKSLGVVVGVPAVARRHATTTVITREIGINMFETRLAFDAKLYEDAARIRLGDSFRLDARRKDVQGHRPGPYLHFWNVWLDRRER